MKQLEGRRLCFNGHHWRSEKFKFLPAERNVNFLLEKRLSKWKQPSQQHSRPDTFEPNRRSGQSLEAWFRCLTQRHCAAIASSERTERGSAQPQISAKHRGHDAGGRNTENGAVSQTDYTGVQFRCGAGCSSYVKQYPWSCVFLQAGRKVLIHMHDILNHHPPPPKQCSDPWKKLECLWDTQSTDWRAFFRVTVHFSAPHDQDSRGFPSQLLSV